MSLSKRVNNKNAAPFVGVSSRCQNVMWLTPQDEMGRCGGAQVALAKEQSPREDEFSSLLLFSLAEFSDTRLGMIFSPVE